MKTEKIEKHMRRRTVVVAKNGTSSDWDVLGVMCDGCPGSVRVLGLSNGKRDYWMHRACNIRKATDDERAQFFAWLISDGTDIADGFARFGGAPRGFEEWQAAQEKPAAPAPWDEQDPLCTPFQPHDEPETIKPPAPKHKRGDLRVWLRSNGIGAVARVTEAGHGGVGFAEYKAYPDDAVYEPTRENVAMLVAKQREHGIKPELGDLVYVMGEGRALERGAVALVTGTIGESVLSVPVWGDISRQLCDVLVIRRNPTRELGDE